jgi:hypothetical protein
MKRMRPAWFSGPQLFETQHAGDDHTLNLSL